MGTMEWTLPLLLLCALSASHAQRLPLDANSLAAAAAQLRTQLQTVFTGSPGARAGLRVQLEAARRLLPRKPPVPEPPPHTVRPGLGSSLGQTAERSEAAEATENGVARRPPPSPQAGCFNQFYSVTILHGNFNLPT